MEKNVRVGVGVYVINQEGKILIGRRKNSHGAGSYSPPGGHLEFGESIEQCATRELTEEAGLISKNSSVNIFTITNDYMPLEDKHYITITTIIKNYKGTATVCEPDKMEKWQWMSWDEIKILGEKLFLPMQNFIKKHPDFDPTK